MTNFLVMPSVALLLHSCFSLFSFQGAVPTFKSVGGDNRDRTDDPLLAKQVLSQLSYTPMIHFFKWWAQVGSNHRPHDYQSCALAS